MAIVADSEESLHFNLNVLKEELREYYMLINVTKDKTMVIVNVRKVIK